jgi:hypothetical protein
MKHNCESKERSLFSSLIAMFSSERVSKIRKILLEKSEGNYNFLVLNLS